MQTIFSVEFLDLLTWANEELKNGNRIKASKIKRAAEKMLQMWNAS